MGPSGTDCVNQIRQTGLQCSVHTLPKLDTMWTLICHVVHQVRKVRYSTQTGDGSIFLPSPFILHDIHQHIRRGWLLISLIGVFGSTDPS